MKLTRTCYRMSVRAERCFQRVNLLSWEIFRRLLLDSIAVGIQMIKQLISRSCRFCQGSPSFLTKGEKVNWLDQNTQLQHWATLSVNAEEHENIGRLDRELLFVPRVCGRTWIMTVLCFQCSPGSLPLIATSTTGRSLQRRWQGRLPVVEIMSQLWRWLGCGECCVRTWPRRFACLWLFFWHASPGSHS